MSNTVEEKSYHLHDPSALVATSDGILGVKLCSKFIVVNWECQLTCIMAIKQLLLHYIAFRLER